MNMNITLRTFLSASALALLFAGTASAQERVTINIASSHPVTNIWVSNMKDVFQTEVDRLLEERGGNYVVDWREAYGGTLYRFTDNRVAVRDRITDIGMVITAWEGAAMPLHNVTFFTPFATTDHELLIDIFDRLTEELPELRAEWTNQNMVRLSSFIADSYDIYATFKIEQFSDLANRRINAPGTSANWLQGTGATPLDGALTTYYTDIQTGVSEGALSFASGILPARVYEVAPQLTRVGIGAMYVGGMAANADFFAELPDEVQEVIREAGRTASSRHGQDVTERAETAIAQMEAAGLTVNDLPEEEKQKWVDSLPNIAQSWLEANGEAAATVLNAYFSALRENGVEPLRAWDEGL
jgi:C4-dicarboxylate-binding protein DctP